MAGHIYKVRQGNEFIWGPSERPERPVPRFEKATSTTVPGHGRNVNKLAWNATATFLASGSDDKTCRVWNVDEGYKQVHKIDQHGDSVVQLCWDPTTPTSLATLAADKAVRIWDLREGRARAVASVKQPYEYINIAWSPDGRHLAVGSSVGTKEEGVKDCVTVLDARTRRAVKRFTFAYEVNEFCWAPVAKHLVLTTAQGTLEVLRAVAPTPDEKIVVPEDRDLILDEDMPPPHADSVWVARGHTDDCYCVDLASDTFGPPLLAVGSKDSLVSIWDLEEMASLRTVARHETPVRCVALSRWGQYVASSCYAPGVDIALAGPQEGECEQVATVDANHAMNSLAWHPLAPVLAYAIDAKSASDKDRRRDDATPPYLRLWSAPLPSSGA